MRWPWQVPFKVHMKIDTGMSRVGVQCDEAHRTIKYIEARNMWVEGLFGHFADAWGRPGWDGIAQSHV